MNTTIIYNTRFWIKETNRQLLFRVMNNLLNDSGYTVINYIDYDFFPFGYTCVWLLAQSHLAIHTFPEYEKSYIELSGCNKTMNMRFLQLIKKKWTDSYIEV